MRVRKKVRADLSRAQAWDEQIASLSPALADRKLCEYTRVLQLSALEQLIYAWTEAKPDAPKPVRLRKKYLAWLAVAVLTLGPMCVPQSPVRTPLPITHPSLYRAPRAHAYALVF